MHKRKRGILDNEFDASIKAQNVLRSLKVDWLPTAALWPAPRLVRTHSKKQIRQLADSIEHFGIVRPIIVDARGQIVAGRGIWEAAKLLGLPEVPVIRISHLAEVEIRAYMLADNRLAEKAGWDRELLTIELNELAILLPQINLDLSITGFDPGEIDSLMLDFGDGRSDRADEIPERGGGAVVARVGDIFVLGKHRLLVGDAREESSYRALMQAEKATMAFLDPPYNVRISGHVGGRGRIKHREFVCASGRDTSDQFISFLEQPLALIPQRCLAETLHHSKKRGHRATFFVTRISPGETRVAG